ncbi:MAG: LPS export ABC transporter permease LptF [Telmatospirillum sp.]|nr:LPS export ABC transporter permease LptF [Telmatospirillum sp.]
MLGIVRYILRQLIVGMVLVTIGLTGILWLTQSLRFVELTVNKGASVAVFLKLSMLVMPNFLTVILPVSLFAVVLFTYNKLITDRELVVLRAAGLSHWMLARPALILAAGCLFLGYALNIWIIPRSVEEFHKLQWTLRSSATNVMLQEGQFNQISPGLTVYVRARSPAGELLGVIVYDRRSPQHTVTLMAERGALIKTDTGTPKVLMINGTREQVTRESHRLSLLYFDNYAMEFIDSSDPGEERARDARERSTSELFSVTEDQVGPTAFRQFRVEGHQRLASPLYHFSFAFVAAACLLSGWFNRRGQADRVILAIALMIAIQAMALGVSNLATRNLAFIPLVYLAPCLPAIAGAWVLLRPSLLRPSQLRAGPSSRPSAG